MAKNVINPELKAHLEATIADFHQQMAAKGFHVRLSKLTADGDPGLICPCGIEYIIDPLTGAITGSRCKRCPRPGI